MALPGSRAKDTKIGRTANADWTEVPNVAFDGPWPVEFPAKCGRRNWDPLVKQWWDIVRVMPHCRLWERSDWLFAVETAYMKQELWQSYSGEDGTKTTAWTELRRREDLLGCTAEARRKLRVRYVEEKPEVGDQVPDDDDPDLVVEEQPVAGRGGSVTPIGSRRQRLTRPA